jgi:hypothetical protein
MPVLLAQKENRKKWTLGVANAIEELTLIFGRKAMFYFNRNGMLTEEQESVLESIYREKKWIKKVFSIQGNLSPKGSTSKVA